MTDLPSAFTAPDFFAYCPKCATPLVTQLVENVPRRVCPGCGYIYYVDPKVGVGVLVMENGRLLLVRRAINPQKGKWSIPAGYVDHGEDPRITAVRETLEETSLEVTITGLEDVIFNADARPGEAGASIFIIYRAKRQGGQLKAGDDADDARFFDIHDLPELAFTSTEQTIQKLKAEIRNRKAENAT